MKRTLRQTPVIKYLTLCYAALLLVLGIVRTIEYKNLQRSNAHLYELVNKSVRRQSILADVRKSVDYVTEDILSILLYPEMERKPAIEEITSFEVSKNDSNLVEYQKLLEGSEEEQFFNKVQSFHTLNAKNSESIVQLIKENKYPEAILFNKNQFFQSNKEFQKANIALADFVKRRDTIEIKSIEQQLSLIDNLIILTTVFILILIGALGFLIGKTIKIMKGINSQLSESESKYRKLTEQANEIIGKFNADGNLVFANDSFKKKLEYSDDELSSLFISDILVGNSSTINKLHPRFKEIITNVKRVLKSKSGKRIYIEGTVFLEYSNEKFVGSMGFFNDVTEKKQLEKSIIASEEKFRQLFNLAPMPMWLFNSKTYQFTQVNKAAITHYGYSEEEFLNKAIGDIRPKEDLSTFDKHLEEIKDERSNLMQQGKTFRGTFKHLTKSKDVIEVEIYNTQLELNNKSEILTVAIDVTERNQLENKITKAIIKTQEDERYEIGSELHDNVCQILATAKINISMLKQSLPSSCTELYHKSQESIELATEEIRNLSHRLAPAFFEDTTLEETFESLVKTFNLEDIYEISFYFDITIKQFPINREIQLNLYRILQEQLRNIVKHAKGSSIEVDVIIHNNNLKMRIADDGVGFKISEVKGGIGLANMKRRAELFSGKIIINSSPGNGCEIVTTIPLLEKNTSEMVKT
jgi:PAS domain S-box-containing protein